MKTVSILGEGAWGTAVATLLAHNGIKVKLWCYHASLADEINKKRVNEQYLSGIQLSENITAVTVLDEAVCDVQWVFEAIPVQYLRSVLEKARDCFNENQIWVLLSKGIEQKTLLFPTGIVEDIFGKKVKQIVFAGPSFARELAEKQITAVTVAAPDCQMGQELQKLLANDYFRPYVTTDMIGVQVGAALKNVIALGVGMLQGAGYGDNPQAFIITRGLHEMMQLSVKLGGTQETIYGLSGVGDLMLTSMGALSRNTEVGRRFGKGQSLDHILKETGYIPEGVNTLQSVYQLIQKENLTLPICAGIYEVIFNNKPLTAMLAELMKQPLSYECNI